MSSNPYSVNNGRSVGELGKIVQWSRLLVFGLLLLVACGGSERATSVPVPPEAVVVATVTEATAAKAAAETDPIGPSLPLDVDHQVAETEHFVFYAEDDSRGYLREQAEHLSVAAEEILSYVSQRMDGSLNEQIPVVLNQRQDTACPARGAYVANEDLILVFAHEESDMEEIRGILAHEIAHIFSGGNQLVHIEAMATWGAGDYWTAWKDAAYLDDLVRSYIRAGDYLPLHENQDLAATMPGQSGEDCLQQRDILYTEWAAFLDYLMEAYGKEKLQALMLPPSQPANENEVVMEPPDYDGVYGMSIEELEEAWLAQLEGEQ